MSDKPSSYRVLARAYRPQRFQDLVGQETLVSVMTKAIRTQRLPQAILLTGVRGVGKTTSARLIAKALNCMTPMEAREEGVEPCQTCEACQAISKDAYLDVIEMDAASRTGVEDMRGIIESAHYRPVSGAYKVYIIDEVHMLSKSAFNALLKTLEEPPENVLFIAATTEIHKVPDTIISRCVRFDLRRFSHENIIHLLVRVLTKETIPHEANALILLARKADGSARDALSLLEQAIHLSEEGVTEAAVRQMLHAGDGQDLIHLFDRLIHGDMPPVLEAPRQTYDSGSDPLSLLKDLADLCHRLSLMKTHPEMCGDPLTPEEDQAMKGLAQKVDLPILMRLWQGLLKGIQEVEMYPQPLHCCEMVLLRLCYMSLWPTPGEVIKQLAAEEGTAPETPQALQKKDPHGHETVVPVPASMPPSFEALVAWVGEQKEPLLQGILRHDVHLISYEPGRLVISLKKGVAKDFIPTLEKKLGLWTGQPWTITLAEEGGQATLQEQVVQKDQTRRLETENHPLVKETLEVFPKATIHSMKNGEKS